MTLNKLTSNKKERKDALIIKKKLTSRRFCFYLVVFNVLLDIINIGSRSLQQENLNLYKAQSIITGLVDKLRARQTQKSFENFNNSMEQLLQQIQRANEEFELNQRSPNGSFCDEQPINIVPESTKSSSKKRRASRLSIVSHPDKDPKIANVSVSSFIPSTDRPKRSVSKPRRFDDFVVGSDAIDEAIIEAPGDEDQIDENIDNLSDEDYLDIDDESTDGDNDENDDNENVTIDLLTEIIDKILNEISFRFDSINMDILKAFGAANPFDNSFMDFETLKPVYENYKHFFTFSFKSECDITRNVLQELTREIPENIDPISYAFKDISDNKVKREMLPNIYKLYIILLTLPVTTASCERQFSRLRRIKTYLRNRSLDDRTSALCVTSSLKNELHLLNLDKLLERFVNIKNRRLLLLKFYSIKHNFQML